MSMSYSSAILKVIPMVLDIVIEFASINFSSISMTVSRYMNESVSKIPLGLKCHVSMFHIFRGKELQLSMMDIFCCCCCRRGKSSCASFHFNFYLFIYLSMAVLGLRFCMRALSSCGKRGPLFIAVHGSLTIAASLVAEHRLQTHRLSNCGSRAQLLCGMWDPPRPGPEPTSPALAGRPSTTAPPEKPLIDIFERKNVFCHSNSYAHSRSSL